MYRSMRQHLTTKFKKKSRVSKKKKQSNVLSKNNTHKRSFFRKYCLKGKVIIPSNITKINNNAFKDCLKLTEIIIPKTVLHIGNNAFDGCFKLTTVTMYESIKFIGSKAFHNCVSLKNIVIKKINSDNYCTLIDYRINNICYSKTNKFGIKPPVCNDQIMDIIWDKCSKEEDANRNQCKCVDNVKASGYDTNCTPPDKKQTLDYFYAEICSYTSIMDNAFSGCLNLDLITIESIDTFRIDGDENKFKLLFSDSPSLKIKLPISIIDISTNIKEKFIKREREYFIFELLGHQYNNQDIKEKKKFSLITLGSGAPKDRWGRVLFPGRWNEKKLEYFNKIITNSLLTNPSREFKPFYPFQIVKDKSNVKKVDIKYNNYIRNKVMELHKML